LAPLQAEGDQIVDLDDQLAEMIALRDEGKIGAIGHQQRATRSRARALPAGIVVRVRTLTASLTAATKDS